MMRLQIIAVGKKMPEWVEVAYQEYLKRFPRDFKITLIEISPANRTGTQKNVDQLKDREGQEILKYIEANSLTIALEVGGQPWSSEEFATKLVNFTDGGQKVNFLIGGPDGLSSSCLRRAQYQFSLSSLTFPHALVRVLLIEQLYRAFTILRHHPYHRF